MNKKRQEIQKDLKLDDLTFIECNTRTNYGFIGYLMDSKHNLMVQIFRGAFYVCDKNFALNPRRLQLIADIQKEFGTLEFIDLKPQNVILN